MAIAVASVATLPIETACSGTITFDKPTGLAAGDILLAVVQHEAGTVSTPSGWTAYTTADLSTLSDVFYKTADSSDAAASTFVFSTSTVTYGGGTLYRITGGIISLIDGDNGTGPGNEDTVSVSLDVTPIIENSLVIITAITADSTASATLSNFYITGGTSPTFTIREQYVETGTDNAWACADAVYTSATAITAAGYSDGTGLDIANQLASIIVIPPQNDVSGTAGLLEVTPQMLAPTASAGTTGTAALLEVTPTVNDAAGRVRAQSNWTNEARGSITWTNEQK